jgi:8-oxo-dGTP pyrophosphatase MutT (NUDIX family)
MISKEPPAGFNQKFEVVSCYLEHEGMFALLHRHDHKSQGGKWGVPAGKVEADEEITVAMKRELKEETGVEVMKENLEYFTKLYVRHGGYDFVYHIFRTEFSSRPGIQLSEKEHTSFRWVFPTEALTLDLVDDMDYCIKLFYKI